MSPNPAPHPLPPSSVTARPAPAFKSVRLAGPSGRVDPRVTAWRADLADVALAGRIAAQRYAVPEAAIVCASLAGVRDRPDEMAPLTSQLLFGERFDILELSGGWAWGQCAHDGYVGYVPQTCLAAAPDSAPTHQVGLPAGLLFSAPDIKAPVLATLPMLACLHATGQQGDFVQVEAGWVHVRHARAWGAVSADPVAVALSLLGTPYLWGGRSRAGIDCSGLVQVSLMACGIACPRDSDMQRTLGEPVASEGASTSLRRGDLVFFKGHVGLMATATDLVHANAHAMAVTCEPLAGVIARLQKQTDRPVEAVRRVSPQA